MQAMTTIRTGEVTGTTEAVRMPDVPCSVVKIKAQSGNSGNVYLGYSSAMTVADGVGDATTGYELDAGDETDWIPVDNLNKFYLRANNNGDDVTYLALK